MDATLEEENARLRQEVATLTRALEAFESSASLDEREARRIFDLFDENRDGLLDEPELRQLAAHLGEEVGGEDWPTGAGWTFEHFYEWWSAPEDEPSAAAATSASVGATRSTLSALRAKLRSQPYMRTVYRLMEKAGQPPPIVSAETGSAASATSTKKGKAKDKGVEGPTEEADEMCRIDIKAQVGPFETPACGGTLTYSFSPDEARQHRKEYKAKDNEALLSLYLTINEGVDDFELGELAGNLRNILLMTKHHYQCSEFKLQVSHEDGDRTFKVTLVFEHSSTVETATGALTGFQIRELAARLELSESPLDEESNGFMRARGSLSAVVHRSVVDFVRGALSDVEEPPQNGQPSDIIALFSALKDINLNLRFDDVGDLYRHAFADAPAADLKGWHSGRLLAMGVLRESLSKKDAADPVLISAYANAKKYLRGLHSARIQLGGNIFMLKGSNLDVIALLPSIAELGVGGST